MPHRNHPIDSHHPPLGMRILLAMKHSSASSWIAVTVATRTIGDLLLLYCDDVDWDAIELLRLYVSIRMLNTSTFSLTPIDFSKSFVS